MMVAGSAAKLALANPVSLQRRLGASLSFAIASLSWPWAPVARARGLDKQAAECGSAQCVQGAVWTEGQTPAQGQTLEMDAIDKRRFLWAIRGLVPALRSHLATPLPRAPNSWMSDSRSFRPPCGIDP